MQKSSLKWYRINAMLVKEFVQMRRDKLTFAMMIGIPILQLVLFGYAINTDPKNLPLAVVMNDHGPFARTFIQGLQNTGYFKIQAIHDSVKTAEEKIALGAVQFILQVPVDFTRKLIRGEKPTLLLEADASDPAATSNAVAAIQQMIYHILDKDLNGTLAHLQSKSPPFQLTIHRRYNPEGLSHYNIVPGLMGVVLTMTMVMMTALAVTRERERGTMEYLLATPIESLEVMIGKILPYIMVGYIQVIVILIAAKFLFEVPMLGSLFLLSLVLVVFITAHLCLGFSFSTIARNQLQAMQMSFFFFLPSMLLSGFMFPFRGMPVWAQTLGEVLPLTHFLRIVRGILLKGNNFIQVWPELWPIILFLIGVAILALIRYQETLD